MTKGQDFKQWQWCWNKFVCGFHLSLKLYFLLIYNKFKLVFLHLLPSFLQYLQITLAQDRHASIKIVFLISSSRQKHKTESEYPRTKTRNAPSNILRLSFVKLSSSTAFLSSFSIWKSSPVVGIWNIFSYSSLVILSRIPASKRCISL